MGRYGLQLCTRVKITNQDPTSGNMKALQITQNRMLRLLNGSRIKDKISIKFMLDKFGLLSVNQLAAKIKIIEVWKTINKEGYPLSLDPYNRNLQDHELRIQHNGVFKDDCRLQKSQSSFHIDAARLWNATSDSIRLAINLAAAKGAADIFCRSLPVWTRQHRFRRFFFLYSAIHLVYYTIKIYNIDMHTATWQLGNKMNYIFTKC